MIEISDSIVLKSISLDDVHAIFDTINMERAYLRKWLPFVDDTLQESDTFAYVQKAIEENQIQYTIWNKLEFVGLIGFNHMDETNKKVEIGYWLSESAQGKGIITLSVRELLIYAFDELDINKIQIRAAVDNERSRKVPERLGFELEGIERDGELLVDGVFTDLAVYGLTKKDFKKHNADN